MKIPLNTLNKCDYGSQWQEQEVPSNLQYKVHQISKLKYLLSHFAVVFVQSIEARC